MHYGDTNPRFKSHGADQDGKAKLTIEKLWEAGVAAGDIAAILAARPAAPEVAGFALRSEGTQNDGGVLRTTWTLEDSGQTNDPAEMFDLVCDFSPAWEDRPLALHPDFEELLKKFEGRVDTATAQIKWEQYLGQSSQGKDVGINQTQGVDKKTKNPMFGRQTYQCWTGGVWTCQYRHRGFPKRAFDGMGGIFKGKAVLGGAPDFEDRDYLKTAPTVKRPSKATALYDVTEQYKLSEIGGWSPSLYKAGKAVKSGFTAFSAWGQMGGGL